MCVVRIIYDCLSALYQQGANNLHSCLDTSFCFRDHKQSLMAVDRCMSTQNNLNFTASVALDCDPPLI